MDLKNIIIVGGGITGLSAAYYLQKEIKENKLPYKVKLLEASDRIGGKIKTLKRDGFIIEQGADSFLGRKKAAVELAEELGMTGDLVRNETGQAYILLNDQLHEIPQGSFMGIPVEASPFLFSDLFSIKGKLRAGCDYIIPKGDPVADQTLGGFFRRRFGHELVEHLIEPLLSGIYSGDIDQMSLMSTFPNFYELEQEYGSLIRGLSKKMPKRRRGTGERPGQFFSFKNGFESLVTKIVEQLDEDTIMFHTAVKQVEAKESGYQVILSDGEQLDATTLIMASPHRTLPKMFKQYDLFHPLEEMPATSVANVALAFDEAAINKTMNGTGFVVSRKSDYRITACTWTNEKWPYTTPDGKVLLRAYVGKPSDQEVVHLPDQEITKIVLNDLRKIMKIDKEPEFTVVTRYKHKMPQYTVGHQDRIHTVREKLHHQLPGVFLAGSSYNGVGVPDCIEQGKKAVAEALEYLQEA